MHLVPVRKLTLPDQQQDLQNAAEVSVASECDGSVKVPRLPVEADSGAIWLPGVFGSAEAFQSCGQPL